MGKSITEALNNLMRRVPGKAWLAAGGLLVGALWLQQHDARIRQQERLQQLRNQTSAEVATLRKQAAQDVKQANVENAKAILKLEQRRQQVEQKNRQLAAQLNRLRRQAHIQAGEVATLPISEIVTRVATQLGFNAGDVATDGTADIANGAISAPANRSAVHGEKTPHPDAGAFTLSPRRGLGTASSADIAMGAISAPPGKKRNTGILRFTQDDERRARDDGSAALALTSTGARKVETALVELNACRSESAIETQQVSNCQARAEAAEAEVKRLQTSIASLNQALQAKDKILAQQQAESKAELRAARGTFLGRLAHTVEHVAIGVALGVTIGVAVK